MKLVLTIVVAALAAFAGRALAPAARATDAQATDANDESAELRAAFEELRAANRRLATEIERREGVLVAASTPAEDVGDAEIAAALERWRAAHEADGGSAAETARAPVKLTPGEIDFASVPMEELVHTLAGPSFGNAERQAIFQKLRENGRIDEYVAAIEKLAAENPKDPDLQVALGHAYLQKLFGVGNTPEAGPLAMKSDAAFDRALELDDHNWSARFSKAVSLSNWPAFLGRGPEAIDNFETLLEQQATQPRRPEFAMTYLFLGNMQASAGDRDKALATWRAGLELFPDQEGLRNAVALAQSQQPPDGRPEHR